MIAPWMSPRAEETTGCPRRSRDIVESSYEAWRRRDADAVIRLCHADVELQLDDQPTVYRGHRGIREAFARELDGWDWLELELDELIECGDEILGLATFRGRGHGSGIEVEHFIGYLWTVDAGLLVRIQVFHDRNRALAAVRPASAMSTGDTITDRMEPMTGSGAPARADLPRPNLRHARREEP
jgi:ketosteroid isomerase-like protein